MIDSQFRVLFGILVVLAAVVPVYLLYRLMGPVAARIRYKSGKIVAQFGGPAALYVVLVWVLLGLLPPPQPCYEPWTVKGSVKLQDEQEPLKETDIALMPPGKYVQAGVFTMNVIATPNAVGKPELPSVLVSHEGYQSVNIPLIAGRIPIHSGYIEVRVDRTNKLVNIEPFVLSKR